MFDNAVIALDLSPADQPLLECLPALQDWGVQKLVLTHVIQFGYVQGSALAHESNFAEWLENCANPLRTAGFTVEVQVRASGDPADEILAVVDETRSKLIVIGSRGKNRISKLFLGSVARDTVRKTGVPLLLQWIEPGAKKGEAACSAVCANTMHHVLLATDFSAQGEKAECAAIALAPKAQKVECVHVMDPDDKDGISETAARAAISNLVEQINARGGRGSGILLKGKPSAEIVRHASEHGASLIVVGKRGQNRVAGKIIGATAENLCELAGRPVLLVP